MRPAAVWQGHDCSQLCSPLHTSANTCTIRRYGQKKWLAKAWLHNRLSTVFSLSLKFKASALHACRRTVSTRRISLMAVTTSPHLQRDKSARNVWIVGAKEACSPTRHVAMNLSLDQRWRRKRPSLWPTLPQTPPKEQRMQHTLGHVRSGVHCSSNNNAIRQIQLSIRVGRWRGKTTAVAAFFFNEIAEVGEGTFKRCRWRPHQA